ncbi:MAG: hypothetical protein QOJ73_2845 [Streptosporangiaceae bacterium]|nr:hypothetical protein [Streptosporangiaceae bacterium]
MHTNGNSSPETARPRSGEPSAPAGRHRVRGWRPRPIRAKPGIAALATVSATGVALALVAGPAGAATKPAWIMTAGNVQTMSQQDSSATSYFFNTPAAYGAGASLVKTPVQANYATTPVLSYTSYTRFKSDIKGGNINYPYKWIMYDPENWSATPVNERQNPVKYMTLFGQLAHANGLKVIQAPALDLAYVTGSVIPRRQGETADQWYVRVNIAGKAAAAADIYQLQNESNTTSGGQYAWMFNTTAIQAQAANANVKVFSEVSTVNGTAAQMAKAAQSISPDGFYVAAAGNVPQTLQFFQLMKTAGY